MAQTDASLKAAAKIDKIAQDAIQRKKFPALSIGIYKEGKVYAKHFGELNPGEGDAPTDQTLYEVASVTKSFTGYVLAQAVSEKKVKLSDDVRQYLPGAYENLVFEGQPIQLRHLVTHTSGLPFVLPEAIEQQYENPDSQLPFRIAEIERKYGKAAFWKDLESVTLQHKPGETYQYSDVGAELVAYVLEQVYQQPFDQILQESLLNKAGMPRSGIHLSEEEETSLAPGYDGEGIRMPYSENQLWAAGAGLKTTLPDMLSFIQFQLERGNPGLIESHKELYRDDDNRVAYFWQIGESKSKGTYLYHHGGAFGAQNWLLIYPEVNMGISLITNQSAPETSGKLSELVNAIFKEIK